MFQSKDFQDIFKRVLEKGLPGDVAHAKMLPTGRKLLTEEEKNMLNYKASAVALVCFPAEDFIYTILTQRHNYAGKHGGQISFPGGKFDLEDIDLEFTARRECYEEIGIAMNEGTTLGKLSEVYIPVSEFVISPYVIFHEERPLLIKNEAEVAEIIQFPLNELITEDNIIIQDVYSSEGIKYKNTPHFCLSQRMVWGATALILSEFREILKQMH